MSKGWLAIATIAFTLVCVQGAARAQTVIYLPEVNLYIPIDPALVTPSTKARETTVVPIGWLVAAGDDTVAVSVKRDASRPVRIDVPDASKRVHRVARPEWAPDAYDATAWDFNYDGSDVALYLATSDGWLTVRVFNASRDLPAVRDMLAGFVNATATMPAGAVLYGTTTTTVTDPVTNPTPTIITDPVTNPTPTIVAPRHRGPRKPIGLEVTLAGRSLDAGAAFGEDVYGGALGLAKGLTFTTKQGFPATFFCTLRGELGYSSYGVDYDAQLRLGLRMGRRIGITPLILGGADAFDTSMPVEGYWGIGAALDAFVSGVIVRVEASTVGRLGPDDVVNGEIRLEATVHKDHFHGGVRRTDYRFGSEHPLVALSLFAGVRL